MRIQPRKQILDVWDSLLRASFDHDREWVWGSGDVANSVTDAEQLLCLLHPMNELEDTFALHDPHEIRDDVEHVLRPYSGSRNRIPRTVIDICSGYFERHTAEGQPTFLSASYLHPFELDGVGVTDHQREHVEIIDSYSMSVTLCLEVLAFSKHREPLEQSPEYRARLVALRDNASRRLTAALIGLLRGFVVNSVDPDSPSGRTILQVLGRSRPDLTGEALEGRVRERFARVRALLHSDVRLGVPERSKPDEDQMFECGWTWGVAVDAEKVDFAEHLPIATASGLADARPYLYFTVVALDGIADLFSRRTRDLDVFDDVQVRLVEALQVRWDLTHRYWSTVARFDTDRWPLEDLPWRTSDGEESDYYSLMVTSVLITDLSNRRGNEGDLAKAIDILEELAARGRITRRLTERDEGLRLHFPGERLRLTGSDVDGPLLSWRAYDFTPLLMKRACQAVRLTNSALARETLMNLAEAAMDQLQTRRLPAGPAAGLWDDVARMVPSRREVRPTMSPSWYLTERVIEALVVAASAYAEDPPRSDNTYELLIRLLSEADHLYNQQLMRTDTQDRSDRRTGLDTIERRITQARRLARSQSGTAVALAQQALLQLNELSAAHDDAMRGV